MIRNKVTAWGERHRPERHAGCDGLHGPHVDYA